MGIEVRSCLGAHRGACSWSDAFRECVGVGGSAQINSQINAHGLVVSGSLTPKKLNQPVTLPEGSTFNGSAEIEYLNYLEDISGTIQGTVSAPPFNATINLLGVPSAVGVTFTQVGPGDGTIAEAPQGDCKAEPEAETCLTLSVPTKAKVGITAVGVLGIKVPTHCETTAPIAFALLTHLSLFGLEVYGPHFAGTTTIPSIACEGLEGVLLGPVLTAAMSGPENPYVLNITRPGTRKPEE